jgi:hypothetical protein
MIMGNHKPGSAAPKPAADTRRTTRATARTERTEAAQPQMERKPFENGG